MPRVGIGRRSGGEQDVGDPLDGLVNMFDIGIVLAVAALVTAAAAISRQSPSAATPSEQLQQVVTPPPDGQRARGAGEAVGTVYRLGDGRLVYVPGRDAKPPPGARPLSGGR